MSGRGGGGEAGEGGEEGAGNQNGGAVNAYLQIRGSASPTTDKEGGWTIQREHALTGPALLVTASHQILVRDN